ncbi:PaaI family thioesterase [uncultured Brevundimonas sp.]|uniref:PaaI family thioesterase n=1 Tax=uncultured Brevundimonas sp. TaxID=213418 RepID=UPI0025DED9FA|nr:PaaI family thioesterase [uncultured Brevundimonas sp.]
MTDILFTLPYARFLGLTSAMQDDELIVTMPFADRLVGDPILPALHGGSTAALLEFTAIAEIARVHPSLRLPRPINVSIAYLRSGKPIAVSATGRVVRAGRRVAHVQATAWQAERDQPIATLTAHFLMNNNNS